MICILSDTHENTKVIDRALVRIREFCPDTVIHCGDIISPPVLEHFRGLPMHFVFGNNDGEREGLIKKCEELNFGEIKDQLELTIQGKYFCVYHGTSSRHLESLIDSQEYHYVLHGHTHAVRDEKIGHTRVINPGALFSAPIYTFAALDVETDKLQFVEIPKNP